MEDPTVAPADAKDDVAVWAERPVSPTPVRRGPSKTRLSFRSTHSLVIINIAIKMHKL